MVSRMRSGSKRWRWLAVGATLAAWPSAWASADEPEPSEDGPALVRQSTPEPAPQPTVTALERFARELTWARWILADDADSQGPDSLSPTLRRAPWLDLADLRTDHWQARPVALTATASAVGSMVVAGLPVLGIVRGGKVRQRHFVRAFFRSKGVALVWRIEF